MTDRGWIPAEEEREIRRRLLEAKYAHEYVYWGPQALEAVRRKGLTFKWFEVFDKFREGRVMDCHLVDPTLDEEEEYVDSLTLECDPSWDEAKIAEEKWFVEFDLAYAEFVNINAEGLAEERRGE